VSDYRAIAVVTATLKRLLQAAANQAVPQTDLRVGTPVAKLGEDGKPLINLFLFRVMPSATQRNAHMPSRLSDGSRRNRSQLALDLHYVLSFYGDAANFEPERLFGAAALALEDAPGLALSAIEAAINDNATALGGADLADDKPSIRVQLESHSLEEFTKLWSVFFQVPYALSATYTASHVVIEVQDRLADAIPVLRRDGFAAPIGPLVIGQAGPIVGASGPVVWGGSLVLTGKGIAAIGNSLRIDGVTRALADDEMVGESIVVTLDDALFGGNTAAIGVHQVQVIAPPAKPGMPDQLRRGSNAMAFAIYPTIALPANAVTVTSGNAALRAGTLDIDVSPPVREGQVVTLFLDARDAANPRSVALPSRTPAVFPATRLTFDFADLPRDLYLVRADVDGFASIPQTGSDPLLPNYGRIVGPLADLS